MRSNRTFAFGQNGRTVITLMNNSVRHWDLPQIPNNFAFLNVWAQTRTGFVVDADGSLRRLSFAELSAAWDKLTSVGSDWLADQTKLRQRRSIDWHRNQAADLEQNGRWFAAAFHLRWLAKHLPEDSTLKQRLELVERRSKDAEGPALVEFHNSKSFARPAMSATWSPDGKQVAYSDNGIVVVDLATNEKRRLTNAGNDLRWSPGDGKYIVFAERPADAEEVWVIDSAGGEPRRLGAGNYPQWLIDGHTVTYHTADNKVVSVDVSEEAPTPKLVFEGAHGHYPAISPDGRFIAHHHENHLLIDRVFDKTTIYRLTLPGWRGMLPVWSRDSRYVTFGSFCNGQVNEMWIFDVERKQACRLASGNFTLGEISPDGTKLLYDNRERSGSSIWMADLVFEKEE
jgi:Tol biopolymer transport system component